MEEYLIYVAILSIGLIMRLFGGGGAVLALPILTEYFGLPMVLAVPATLLSMFCTAGLASCKFIIQRSIDFKIIFSWFVYCAVGSVIGSAINQLNIFSDMVLKILFVCVLSLSAISMIRSKTKIPEILADKIYILATTIGVMTGLLGISGGFLLTPSLILFYGFSVDTGARHVLLIVTLNTFIASLSYINIYKSIDQNILILFCLLPVVGVVLGEILSRYIKLKKKILGYFLLGVAVYMLV